MAFRIPPELPDYARESFAKGVCTRTPDGLLRTHPYEWGRYTFTVTQDRPDQWSVYRRSGRKLEVRVIDLNKYSRG